MEVFNRQFWMTRNSFQEKVVCPDAVKALVLIKGELAAVMVEFITRAGKGNYNC